MKKYLWLRLGDAAEYERFGSVEEIAQQLFDGEVDLDFVISDLRHQIFDGKFSGDNHISVFWGDYQAEIINGLSKKEVELVRDSLRGKWADWTDEDGRDS